ncbi:hypothetical protein MTO96_016670 [Rhipicephalus appendiculatus]
MKITSSSFGLVIMAKAKETDAGYTGKPSEPQDDAERNPTEGGGDARRGGDRVELRRVQRYVDTSGEALKAAWHRTPARLTPSPKKMDLGGAARGRFQPPSRRQIDPAAAHAAAPKANVHSETFP